MKKAFSLLLLLTCFINCKDDKSALTPESLQGFWKVHQVSREGAPPQELYADISDSIIQYWYHEVQFILPYGYHLKQDHLIIWVHGDSTSQKVDVGVLDLRGDKAFTLENASQQLTFERMTREDFTRETGKSWQPPF